MMYCSLILAFTCSFYSSVLSGHSDHPLHICECNYPAKYAIEYGKLAYLIHASFQERIGQPADNARERSIFGHMLPSLQVDQFFLEVQKLL